MGIRLSIVIGAVFIAYSYLLFHIYDIQLNNGLYYQKRAESQYLASNVIQARRGVIYFTDKNGTTDSAALQRDFPLIFAAPKYIKDPEEAAQALAPLLNMPREELARAFSATSSQYKLLARKADSSLVNAVQNLALDGIYLDSELLRYYPFGSLASHLLGFVSQAEGEGESGQYGVEAYYNEALSGKAGEILSRGVVDPEQGEDVVLTIDLNIQQEAERILNNVIKNYNAKGGSVIVQEPHTGKILALGNTPSFDPNNYRHAELSDFKNSVVQDKYEPGSVYKVLTMAAGIDSGKVTPETTYVDSGTLTVSGRTISNFDFKTHGAYGKINMTTVIERSLNVGAAFVEKTMGHDIFLSYFKKFGLDEKTGIDLPGEEKGDLRQLHAKAPDINFVTASYGQGVDATPIEVISAIGAIANGGELMRPYLNANTKPEVRRRVISEDTAQKVTRMMVSAVDKAGIAKIDGYELAGKTGTAFIPDFERGGYTDRVINTFVGFGPARDPKFIILIKLNDPEGAPVAGLSVVPAFRDLAQFILNYYNIPPDRLSE